MGVHDQHAGTGTGLAGQQRGIMRNRHRLTVDLLEHLDLNMRVVQIAMSSQSSSNETAIQSVPQVDKRGNSLFACAGRSEVDAPVNAICDIHLAHRHLTQQNADALVHVLGDASIMVHHAQEAVSRLDLKRLQVAAAPCPAWGTATCEIPLPHSWGTLGLPQCSPAAQAGLNLG